jgi:hypothetical protein
MAEKAALPELKTVPAGDNVRFAERPKLRLQNHSVVKAPPRVGGAFRVVNPSQRSTFAVQAADDAKARVREEIVGRPKRVVVDGRVERKKPPRSLSPTEAFTRTMLALPAGEVDPFQFRALLQQLAQELENSLDLTQINWGAIPETKGDGVGGFLSCTRRFGPLMCFGGQLAQYTGRWSPEGAGFYRFGPADAWRRPAPVLADEPSPICTPRHKGLTYQAELIQRTSDMVGPGSYDLPVLRPIGTPTRPSRQPQNGKRVWK